MAEEKKEKKYIPLDEAEINLFKAYGLGPYAESIKKLEEENKEMVAKINKLTGSGAVTQASRSWTRDCRCRRSGTWRRTRSGRLSSRCRWRAATRSSPRALRTNT
jgi:hypothetical protein